MKPLITIKSSDHSYNVEEYESLARALGAVEPEGTFALVDQFIFEKYADAFRDTKIQCLPVVATEEQKSFEKLTPLFVWLLKNGLKRDGRLLVIGGGVVQDIGCFIASVLFRGVKWELIPHHAPRPMR